jgi:uncharacterized membrane protein
MFLLMSSWLAPVLICLSKMYSLRTQFVHSLRVNNIHLVPMSEPLVGSNPTWMYALSSLVIGLFWYFIYGTFQL